MSSHMRIEDSIRAVAICLIVWYCVFNNCVVIKRDGDIASLFNNWLEEGDIINAFMSHRKRRLKKSQVSSIVSRLLSFMHIFGAIIMMPELFIL